MLGQIFELAKELLGLTRDVRETRAQLEKLEMRVERLAEVVQRLSTDVELLSERQTSGIENLELRLRNTLLQFERRLPPPSGSDADRGPAD